jgi:hypothetical protein
MVFNRFSIVPELSSAARIPFPGATSFVAIDSKVSVFMLLLLIDRFVVLIIASNKFVASLKTLALHLIEGQPFAVEDFQCTAFVTDN